MAEAGYGRVVAVTKDVAGVVLTCAAAWTIPRSRGSIAERLSMSIPEQSPRCRHRTLLESEHLADMAHSA